MITEYISGECADCDTATKTMLKDEAAKYKDILQLNFTDTYRNLTLKTLTSFKWIHSKCSHVPFYLKIDDDIFVDLEKILQVLGLRYTMRSLMA